MAEQLYCSGIYSHQNLFVQDICWHVLFIVHDVISSHKTMVAKKGHPRAPSKADSAYSKVTWQSVSHGRVEGQSTYSGQMGHFLWFV